MPESAEFKNPEILQHCELKEKPTLPIHAHKERIVQLLDNQVTVIVSPTGTGKTTQVPQYAFETGEFDKIIVTQPRIIAARELCNRVSQETEGRCTVGYYTSKEGTQRNQDDNDVIFLTDGKQSISIFKSDSYSRYLRK